MPGENEFDMNAAVSDLSADLGFDDNGGQDDNGTSSDSDLDLDNGGDRSGVAGLGGGADAAGVEGLVEAPEAGAVAAGAAPNPLTEAPKTWRKEAAATWATLPAEVRAEIHKREQDIFSGIEAYKGDAAFGKSVQGALAPYMPVLKQYGIDPVAQVSGLMQAHHTLALGTPEQKMALFQKLASDYKIDLNGLDPANAPYIDPAVKALQPRLDALESRYQADEQRRFAEAKAETEKHIESFAKDPANAHFAEVANDMADLLQKGVCKTLPEAYEKAVWGNPVVRAKEIGRQQAAEASKRAAEEATRVANARKATAANVRTSAKSGSAATPLGSMDDTLAETLAAIQARA